MNHMFLFLGIPAFVSGCGMLLFPRARRLSAQAKAAQRKQELAAGAPERFFEEGRTLEAYPPPNTDGKWRAKGAVLAICGASLLVLAYFG